ncbi:MAG: glycosyltransferase family 39 protein [Terriglobales bacterium]|jgi:4-amino-4-deoxy-L-arabinose transferase-like glycosyltransferase
MSETLEAEKNGVRAYGPMVAAALAVRLAVIPFLYRDWLDPFVLEHWAFGRVARSLVAGHGFGNVFADTGPTTVVAPVYAYLLAVVFRLFGTYTLASIVAALALNSLFSALTCIPVFLLARRCFGARAAKWAGWGWAFSPYGIYYGADWAWSTCLVTLLLAVLFLWALALEESGTVWQWLGFGALGGFAALTEPVVLAVIPLFGLWTCWRRLRRRQNWMLPMMAAALGAIAVMAPWFVRDYRTFHQFIPIRSGFGLELYIGNSADSMHWVDRSLHPNHSDAELAEYAQRGELAYMAHKAQQGKEYIRSHPGQYAYRIVRRVVYIWTGYWSFDRAYLAEEPLDVPNIFLSTTMTVLALAGLRRLYRANTGSGLAVRFAIVFVFFPLAYYFSHPETYYFRPVDPLIVVLAAYFVTERFGRPRKSTLLSSGDSLRAL